MSISILIIGSVLLFGIVCVSVYGARVLPADSRLPLHFGPAGYTNWQSRNVALLIWPVTAVAVFVIIIVSARNQHPGSGHGLPLPLGLTVALVLILVNFVGAIRAALNRSGRS
jgi:hypothetical protein